MAAKAIVGSIENAVMLNLSAIEEEKGFNMREASMKLGEMVQQIVAKGRVVTPITVYKRDQKYVPIAGHRRTAGMKIIQQIQAGDLSPEQAKAIGISQSTYDNAKNADIAFQLPAIIQAEGELYERRLDSLLSNAGEPLSAAEQAAELFALKQALKKLSKKDYAEAIVSRLRLEGEAAAAKRAVIMARKGEEEVVQNKDLAELTGFSTGHISGRLSTLEKRSTDTDDSPKIRDLVNTAVQRGEITQADAQNIVRKAKTLKEAVDCVDALVEEKALAAAQKQKGGRKSKGEEPMPVSKPLPLTGLKHVDIAPPSTSAPVPSPTSAVNTQAELQQDLAMLFKILERQGISFVVDSAEKWAIAKKRTFPYARVQASDKAA